MWNVFKKGTLSTSSHRRKRPQLKRSLLCEQLEDRRVLAAMVLASDDVTPFDDSPAEEVSEPPEATNQPPTAIEFIAPILSLPEATDASEGIVIASVQIIDDGEGINTITLSGEDSAFFTLVEGELIFTATELDRLEKPFYRVTLSVTDAELEPTLPEGTLPVSREFELEITDGNLPPTGLAIEVEHESLPQTWDTSEPTKLAQIEIEDDGVGENVLSLSGTDADQFELIGNELWLRAGVVLNAQDKSTYTVNINVADASNPTEMTATQVYELTIHGPPQVHRLVLPNPEGAQSRLASIVIEWDSLVEIEDGAFSLFKTDVSGEVDIDSVESVIVDGRSVTTVTFKGDLTRNGELVSGVFSLQLDGEKVSSTTSDMKGVSFDSQPIVVWNDPALRAIDITAPSVVVAGQTAEVTMELGELSSEEETEFELRIDWGTGQQPEVISATDSTLSLSRQFTRPGSQVIAAELYRDGELIRSGRWVVDVSPVGNLSEDWLYSSDVDRDNTVSPLDVLAIINEINSRESPDSEFPLLLDADRDGILTPLDALAVINFINRSEETMLPSFASLTMNQSLTVPGLTNSPRVEGKIESESRNLYVMLNQSEPHDISHLVEEDGTFELTDAAITELFGTLPDQLNTLSLGLMRANYFQVVQDKRFLTYEPDDVSELPFEITTSVPFGGQVLLEWLPLASSRYSVIVSNIEGEEEARFDGLSDLSKVLSLGPGEYSIVIESTDIYGTKRSTDPVSIELASEPEED